MAARIHRLKSADERRPCSRIEFGHYPLLGTDRNLRLANDKAPDVTMKKLTGEG